MDNVLGSTATGSSKSVLLAVRESQAEFTVTWFAIYTRLLICYLDESIVQNVALPSSFCSQIFSNKDVNFCTI